MVARRVDYELVKIAAKKQCPKLIAEYRTFFTYLKKTNLLN